MKTQSQTIAYIMWETKISSDRKICNFSNISVLLNLQNCCDTHFISQELKGPFSCIPACILPCLTPQRMVYLQTSGRHHFLTLIDIKSYTSSGPPQKITPYWFIKYPWLKGPDKSKFSYPAGGPSYFLAFHIKLLSLDKLYILFPFHRAASSGCPFFLSASHFLAI